MRKIFILLIVIGVTSVVWGWLQQPFTSSRYLEKNSADKMDNLAESREESENNANFYFFEGMSFILIGIVGFVFSRSKLKKISKISK